MNSTLNYEKYKEIEKRLEIEGRFSSTQELKMIIETEENKKTLNQSIKKILDLEIEKKGKDSREYRECKQLIGDICSSYNFAREGKKNLIGKLTMNLLEENKKIFKEKLDTLNKLYDIIHASKARNQKINENA